VLLAAGAAAMVLAIGGILLYGAISDRPRQHVESGSAYYNKGDYNRTIADYTEAVRLDPDDADYKNNLAAARRARGW
jgi:tetratricopeptide (TPR) repeat protein